jgi:hypothetical protein
MILHYIPKDQLRQSWNFVKQGLEIVRSKGHTEWIVEDVYCDCYENRSMLFLAIQDNVPFGFVVLQPIGNTLHVWAAWSNLNDKNIIDICFEEIKAIAMQGYKEKITFTSQRKGWERNARQMGFTPSTWEYKLNG